MQIIETKEGVHIMIAVETSLFATFSGWKTLENHLTHKLLWCLVAFQHHFHAKSETEEKFLFLKRFLITPFCCHSAKLVGRANYNKPD